MKLLPNEEKLMSSKDDKVVLTNYRIQNNDSQWGKSFTQIIFLEDISSIEVKYKDSTLFLMLAVICIVAAILGGLSGNREGSNIMSGGILFGLIFFILWWVSRKHTITISSN